MTTRKPPVRWTLQEQDAVWRAFQNITHANRGRGLTWQIDHAQQQALPAERWRRINGIGAIPAPFRKRLVEVYPSLLESYPHLAQEDEVPCDKDAFVQLLVEARLENPYADFVDLWNESIGLAPELNLREASAFKYVDQEIVSLVEKRCRELLDPPKLPPEPLKLEEHPASQLIAAYHRAILRETAELVEKLVREEQLSKTPPQPFLEALPPNVFPIPSPEKAAVPPAPPDAVPAELPGQTPVEEAEDPDEDLCNCC